MSTRPARSWGRLSTETVHPGSENLDRLGVDGIVGLMQSEDRRVLGALAAARPAIVRAAKALRATYLTGGDCLLFGAGTSGRLAVVEAAELPPTFGTDPRRVHAIIAGGRSSVFRSREGAEDSSADGSRGAARVRPGDLVIGVSASAVTPFVRGALSRARARGALTVLITASASGARSLASIVVVLPVGPEVVAGSTRLKAGTATKLALNQITTAAFASAGRVFGPWMIDLARGSAKLKNRAARIVAAACATTPERGRRLLTRARGNMRAAIVMGATGVSYRAARAALEGAGGDLRAALPEGSSRRVKAAPRSRA